MECLAAEIRVLIVEDNPGDADLVAIALAGSTRPRFLISGAATLAKAVEHIRSGAGTDVVLLDLSLPDASGEATVARMRKAAPNLPIVIMTGHDDAEFAERMVAIGAQDYLVKGDASGPIIWRAIRYAITRMQQAIEREVLVEELRASVEMKNRMFGILAHDLRNPIGAVSGYAEFLEMTDEDRGSERVKRSLATIRESAAYMNDLIEDVLALAVADAGEVTLVRQTIDVGTLARNSVAFSAVAAERKGVRLRVDEQAVWIAGDAVKIGQVLNNLIGNAIKFSKAGDVVTVSVTRDERFARLSVADQGIGIPDGVRANLFKPFIKGKTGTGGEPSNGLGLYICSRIVDAHGGGIEVNSEAGTGTTFTVILPDVLVVA